MVVKSGSYLCCLISEVTSEPCDETLADLNLRIQSNLREWNSSDTDGHIHTDTGYAMLDGNWWL